MKCLLFYTLKFFCSAFWCWLPIATADALFFLCTCWLNYLILWQKLVSLYMYVTWIDMRVVRSVALTLYSFCFDAQLVYQHPIKVIKLIKLLHSCLFLFATFDTLFYYLPFVSTICVCASSCVWVCVRVYRCFGLSVFAWLHHRIGFSNLFLYYVSLILSLSSSFFVLTNMGMCWIMSTWWHHHEGSINYKRTYGFNSQAWL